MHLCIYCTLKFAKEEPCMSPDTWFFLFKHGDFIIKFVTFGTLYKIAISENLNFQTYMVLPFHGRAAAL